jgi:hypothetical protein
MPCADLQKQRAYQNEWIKQRRRRWTENNGPCVDCDSWEELEVDHQDWTSKVTHRVWSWNKKRREAELSKCVVRCHECHVEKSRKDHNQGENHPCAILTEEQARYVRYESGDRKAIDIAVEFGVSLSCIYDIRRGRKWRHV